MLGKLETVVLDTRDPQGLAEFYAGLLGGTTVVERENWVSIEDGTGAAAFRDPAGHLAWD